jgi:hypothetical protein
VEYSLLLNAPNTFPYRRSSSAHLSECLHRLGEVLKRCICGSSSAAQNQRKAKKVIDATTFFCVPSQDEKTPSNRRLHCLLHHQPATFRFSSGNLWGV